jgi:hypothetical protein
MVEIYTGMSALPAVGKNVKIISGLVSEPSGQFGCELFRTSNQTIFWYNYGNFLHITLQFPAAACGCFARCGIVGDIFLADHSSVFS